eukprot:2798105-Prymnesium_polylepis.1
MVAIGTVALAIARPRPTALLLVVAESDVRERQRREGDKKGQHLRRGDDDSGGKIHRSSVKTFCMRSVGLDCRLLSAARFGRSYI